MSYSLSCTIMQAPFFQIRRLKVENIVKDLGVENIQKYWDDFQIFGDWHKRGCWWNAKRCWEHGASLDTTHHLLMQDDIKVCKDFCSGVFKVIEAFPSDVLSLFFGKRRGLQEGLRWGEAEGVWGQAVVMPHDVLVEFLEWEKENIDPSFPHDDARLTLFLIHTGRRAKIPYPNLVDHSTLKSVMGNNYNQPRVSIDFMGDRSPHDFDWHDKEETMKSFNSYTQYNHYLLKGKNNGKQKRN